MSELERLREESRMMEKALRTILDNAMCTPNHVARRVLELLENLRERAKRPAESGYAQFHRGED